MNHLGGWHDAICRLIFVYLKRAVSLNRAGASKSFCISWANKESQELLERN